MSIGSHGFIEETLLLVGEDLRAARTELGISSTVAAERAELDADLYRALEAGDIGRNRDNVALMVSGAKRLGLGAVRFSYVDEVQQYMKVDLSTDGPVTAFVDTLRLDVRKLKEESLFVSPNYVLALVERIGFFETLASKRPVDRELIELWVAAVFTLCLNRDQDHYVRLVRDDPPDAEVLAIDEAAGGMRAIKVEITQHGSHSTGLTDVIAKKLRKKYEEGTVLVVLVEQAASIPVAELDNFIQRSNRYGQRIYIIGGSDAPGTFKVVPWEEVTKPTPDETEWLEIGVDGKNASKGHRGFEGVFFNPPCSRFLPGHPTFVKELELHQEME